MQAYPPAIVLILAAKTVRTFGYGYLGILLPVYLAELGVGATGVGAAVTLTLVASALLTWAVRRPAERHGARAALLGLAALMVMGGLLLLASKHPWLVVVGAMVGNVAVGSGETGPFLTIEQVVIARAVTGSRRTAAFSVYNLIGYAAAGFGAAVAGVAGGYQSLFLAFVAGAVLQLAVYWRLPVGATGAVIRSPAPRGSAPLIRRMATLFSLDSFAGGFVLQSLVAYFLHTRFGLALADLGLVFFAAQLLTAASLLLATPLAHRFGLLPTMVVSHLVSNVLLIAIAVAPSATAAVALLLGRQLLSQIDVPTRQAYVMAVVEDHEREAAASLTTLTRTVAQAASPALTGWTMQALALGAPFVLGGGLKMLYDVLLYIMFRDVKLKSERT
ncbi:MAG TPA: MFS transporter [Methylomirabilota bacterium]|nr:MFS transporter [Methylomirabilota bacterium]